MGSLGLCLATILYLSLTFHSWLFITKSCAYIQIQWRALYLHLTPHFSAYSVHLISSSWITLGSHEITQFFSFPTFLAAQVSMPAPEMLKHPKAPSYNLYYFLCLFILSLRDLIQANGFKYPLYASDSFYLNIQSWPVHWLAYTLLEKFTWILNGCVKFNMFKTVTSSFSNWPHLNK